MGKTLHCIYTIKFLYCFSFPETYLYTISDASKSWDVLVRFTIKNINIFKRFHMCICICVFTQNIQRGSLLVALLHLKASIWLHLVTAWRAFQKKCPLHWHSHENMILECSPDSCSEILEGPGYSGERIEDSALLADHLSTRKACVKTALQEEIETNLVPLEYGGKKTF